LTANGDGAGATRIAVVTGAGRGFGREIARRLAARGFSVLATDIDLESAQETAQEIGSGAWAMALDVRDPEAHRRAAAQATEHGRLEVWVNNAGVIRTGKAWQHEDDEVRLIVESNLLGVIYGSRAAVSAMRSNPEGARIINISSLSAFGAVPGLTIYGATKHAVLGFSRSLQGDLDAAGIPIRVHAVCPDTADTPMVRERADEPDAAIVYSAPRFLTADEVADATVGLLDNPRVMAVIPRWRGVIIRAMANFPALELRLVPLFRKMGERRRRKDRAFVPR
jgi:NAD(P)-dependent dehydrogenase (short-subunit alcohol dehydrogenase family)